jgi:succinoglycan biosynthesis protein ExoM
MNRRSDRVLEELRIIICACTYQRPAGLAALLGGLGAQTFEHLQRPNLRIVIADNEGSDRARELCAQFEASGDIPIEYLHEPRRGISHARNACLARLRDDCDFFAMIDDDEIPNPDWIEQLLLAQQRTGADVVQGRVIAVFPDGAPDWITQGRYFGWPIGQRRDAHHEGYPELDKAMTNNVLVRHAAVRNTGLRFDPQFGLTGGGDIVFFRAIRAAGFRIVYAPDASVRETIPLERANLRYLWWRWYRVGSNARFKRPITRKPNASLKRIVRQKWQSSGCSEICTGLAILTARLRKGRTAVSHLAPGIKRIAHGLGQAASAIGIRYEQYRDGGGGEGLHNDPREDMDR